MYTLLCTVLHTAHCTVLLIIDFQLFTSGHPDEHRLTFISAYKRVSFTAFIGYGSAWGRHFKRGEASEDQLGTPDKNVQKVRDELRHGHRQTLFTI